MAMANLFGYTSVAEFATTITTLDDMVDPSAAQIAKTANVPSIPYDHIATLQVLNGTKKVEFRVELTEQLLIFTIKSVLDECFSPFPEVQLPIHNEPVQHKAHELLVPID